MLHHKWVNILGKVENFPLTPTAIACYPGLMRRSYIPTRSPLDIVKRRILDAISDYKLPLSIFGQLLHGLRLVDNGLDTPCWIRGDDSEKYTTVDKIRAHRMSYFLFRGKQLINNGCHHCDKPACINPDHIFDGTTNQNNRDAMDKKRMACNEFTVSKIKKEIAINKQAENFSEPQYVSGVDRTWNQFPPREL